MGRETTLPDLTMSDLLAVLKPYFLPHYDCFQYGAGRNEIWFAKRCLRFIVVTDQVRDYAHLLVVRQNLDIPGLTPCLVPTREYRDYILRFAPKMFDLIIVHIMLQDFELIFHDVIERLKPSGILVLPSGQLCNSLVDWEQLGEGVYRKPYNEQ